MAVGIHRYAISRMNRLIDTEPMQRNELPLVWSRDRKEWIEMELTFGEHVDSIPITEDQAQHFMETGEISEFIKHGRIAMSDDSSDSEE